MPARRWNPFRLLALAMIALAAAVALIGAAVVLAFVLTAGADEDDDTATPDAPTDLCAVVGRDDLAAWVPGSDPTSTVDGGEATCEATTADGGGQLTARVSRSALREDQLGPSGEATAESAFARSCTEAQVADLGIGDESCLVHANEAGTTGSARVAVRQGADLVTVTYVGDRLAAGQAQERAVVAATRIAADLRR